MGRSSWTNEELEFLKNNYLKYSDLELSEIFGTHTECAIATKRRNLKLNKENRQYTYDDAIIVFNEKGYQLLSTEKDYINVNSKLKYICPKHGERSIALSKLLIGRGCNECGRERTVTARTINFDDDEYRQICESLDYTYVSANREHKGKSKRICLNFICNKHKEYGVQSSIKDNLARGTLGCVYCHRKNLPKEYIESELKLTVPNIKILSDYNKIMDKVDCVCIKHDYHSNTTIQELLLGKGCKYCGIEKLSESNKLDIEDVINRIHESCEYIDIIGEYHGVNERHKFKCNKCNYEWNGIIQSKMRCPNCGIKYSGENIVRDSLKSLGMDYVCQKSFDDCRDKKKLPFDFYLPEYNICIEYNGQQHYKPIKYYGGEVGFEVRRKHDQIKRDYCKNNGYKLIEIPYTVSTLDEVKNIILDNIK